MAGKFTDEVLDFIRKDYVGVTNKEMALRLEREFGGKFTPKSVGVYRCKIGCTSGNDGRFYKGQTPHNKGVKGTYPGCEKGWFKKGCKVHNQYPVGTEVFKAEGYWKTKIAEPNVWKYTHHLVWENAHGEIPKGHVVIFKDGDVNNRVLENLMCISKAEFAVINRFGLKGENGQMVEFGLNVAKLMIAVSTKQKQLEGE